MKANDYKYNYEDCLFIPFAAEFVNIIGLMGQKNDLEIL